MAGLLVKFRGQCLSSVAGPKTAYTKFMCEPEIGVRPVEFQVSCKDLVEPDYCWKLADWELLGFEPISGEKDGRKFAFFSCTKIVGKLVKV